MQLLSTRAACLAATFCLGLASTASGVADAAEYDNTTVTVTLRGLDLTTDAGQATARHRILLAAHRACGAADPHDLRATMDYDRCRQDAAADAMPALQARVDAARANAQFATR